MTSAFASYFLVLAIVANLFYLKTCLCVDTEGEALIAGICRKVQDPTFCFNTFHQNIPNHPYTPTEVTRVAISQSLQHATDNRIFIEASKENSTDTEIQNLYAICDSGYGFLSTELQDASLSLAQQNYNALENSLSKCPRFVSDCHDAFGDKTTPELLDRNRKQLDLVLMANFAEVLIQK